MNKKGKIYPIIYAISCGRCYTTAQLNARSKGWAEHFALNEGWRHTSKQGWLCPKCKDLTDK